MEANCIHGKGSLISGLPGASSVPVWALWELGWVEGCEFDQDCADSARSGQPFLGKIATAAGTFEGSLHSHSNTSEHSGCQNSGRPL